jgi:hypothetical protein
VKKERTRASDSVFPGESATCEGKHLGLAIWLHELRVRLRRPWCGMIRCESGGRGVELAGWDTCAVRVVQLFIASDVRPLSRVSRCICRRFLCSAMAGASPPVQLSSAHLNHHPTACSTVHTLSFLASHGLHRQQCVLLVPVSPHTTHTN